ncbi:MAG: hypothetical protein KJN99_08800 [Marinicaulis sp.]|nr:hypothetical protein [Marinicaulis sp.]
MAENDEKLKLEEETENFGPAGAPKLESPFGSLAQSIGARNLMIAIVTMPAVFLVVVLAIIGVFGKPKVDETETAAVATPVRSTEVDTLQEPARVSVPVTEPSAASVNVPVRSVEWDASPTANAISLDGDRLAVRMMGGEGEVIVIFDLEENEVVQTVPVSVFASAVSMQRADDIQTTSSRNMTHNAASVETDPNDGVTLDAAPRPAFEIAPAPEEEDSFRNVPTPRLALHRETTAADLNEAQTIEAPVDPSDARIEDAAPNADAKNIGGISENGTPYILSTPDEEAQTDGPLPDLDAQFIDPSTAPEALIVDTAAQSETASNQ